MKTFKIKEIYSIQGYRKSLYLVEANDEDEAIQKINDGLVDALDEDDIIEDSEFLDRKIKIL